MNPSLPLTLKQGVVSRFSEAVTRVQIISRFKRQKTPFLEKSSNRISICRLRRSVMNPSLTLALKQGVVGRFSETVTRVQIISRFERNRSPSFQRSGNEGADNMSFQTTKNTITWRKFELNKYLSSETISYEPLVTAGAQTRGSGSYDAQTRGSGSYDAQTRGRAKS